MNPSALYAKQKNARKILDYVINNIEVSRSDIAFITGLSMGTVTNIVTELIDNNLLYESRHSKTGAGRSTSYLRFKADKGYTVNISTNSSGNEISLCNLLGDVIYSEATDIDIVVNEKHSEIEIIKEYIHLFKNFLSKINDNYRNRIIGIGFAVGGMVDRNHAVTIPLCNWDRFNIVKPLQQALGIPVYAEGITRIKAQYELRWLNPSEKNVIYLNISTGIGMVHFFDGKMVCGSTGIAGEIGHISLNMYGPKCYCGNCGCFENYCGMNNILQRCISILKDIEPDDPLYILTKGKTENVKTELVFEALNAGSLSVRQLFNDVTKYLGMGLTSIYNIYDPDHVVLSGYLDGKDDSVIDTAISEARKKIINPFVRNVRITRSRLRTDQRDLAISLYVTSCYLDTLYS